MDITEAVLILGATIIQKPEKEHSHFIFCLLVLFVCKVVFHFRLIGAGARFFTSLFAANRHARLFTLPRFSKRLSEKANENFTPSHLLSNFFQWVWNLFGKAADRHTTADVCYFMLRLPKNFPNRLIVTIPDRLHQISP